MNLSDLGSRFILIHEGGAGKYAVSSNIGSNQIYDLQPLFAVAFNVALCDS